MRPFTVLVAMSAVIVIILLAAGIVAPTYTINVVVGGNTHQLFYNFYFTTFLLFQVPMVSNQGTTGLGGASVLSQTTVVDKSLTKKLTVWKKTQIRYSKIQEAPAEFSSPSSDDEES